jgi:DNA invertase Pin-like site-specific DNA recombinase
MTERKITIPGAFITCLEDSDGFGAILANGVHRTVGKGSTLTLTFSLPADADAWHLLAERAEFIASPGVDAEPAERKAARTVLARIAELESAAVVQPAPAVEAAPAPKTNAKSTRAVILNLTKLTGRDSYTELWESIPADSVEEFREHAMGVLGNVSGLRTRTMKSADWTAVFEHFHDEDQAPAVEAEPVRQSGALIGYGRVSTRGQDTQLQHDALNAAGCIRIYEEKMSGKTREGREKLAAALDFARPGDTVCVWKLDRLGRSTLDILNIANDLHERGIGLKVLTGRLTGTYSPNGEGKFFFTIMAAFAELERDMIRERTIAGLEAARAEGRVGGRPSVVDADKLAALLARRAKGESVVEAARELKISKSAAYRALADADQ